MVHIAVITMPPADDEQKNEVEGLEETIEEQPEQSGKPRPLIICPTMTKETMLVSFAADELNKYFIKHGFSPMYLTDLRVRKGLLFRSTFLNPEFKRGQNLVIYYGHGFPDSWVGLETPRHRLVPRTRLLVNGVNTDWIANSNYIYTMACYTMQSLGKSMVKDHGALLYGGSKSKVNFELYDSIHDDEMSYDFVEVFNSFPIALAHGLTIGQAIEVFYKTIDEYLRRYERSGELNTNELMKNQYYGLKIIRDNYVFLPKNKQMLDRRWLDKSQM